MRKSRQVQFHRKYPRRFLYVAPLASPPHDAKRRNWCENPNSLKCEINKMHEIVFTDPANLTLSLLRRRLLSVVAGYRGARVYGIGANSRPCALH